MLRNITAALPGIAFQLALEAVSPLLGGLTKWAKGLETWINNARINSCETATASCPPRPKRSATLAACLRDLALQMGMESDIDAAMRRCATDSPSILGSAPRAPIRTLPLKRPSSATSPGARSSRSTPWTIPHASS
jgi:conjugative transfer pilus assembly protein TraH